MNKVVGLLALALLAGSPTARAYIVDTGTPDDQLFVGFNSTQYFAGQFTLAGSYSISSVEAWIGNYSFSSSPGSVTVRLHSNGSNDLPGTVLQSQSFAVPGYAEMAWRGVAGLAWSVGPGTYWVSFTPDSSIDGAMNGYAPSPLDAYAASFSAGDVWQDFSGVASGMRIDGSAAPVPLPAAAWLLLSGLGGLGLLRRRKAN